MIKRIPAFAGMFYQSDFDKLDKQIASCFVESKFGPGTLPENKKNKTILGGIAPHAGYNYSGPCAAYLYKEIAESKFADCYIILGTNHTGIGPEFSTYLSDWQTPFGDIRTDTELGLKLIELFPELKNEPSAHIQEHSIEVQLPFLQFALKDNLNQLKILPILIKSQSYEDCLKLGKAISQLAKEKSICIIASSDFTHYGPSYGFVPFLSKVKENLYELDKKAINYIEKLKSKEFYNHSRKTTICGAFTIITAIEACKILGAKKAKLLNYYTSGDIANDYKNAVGYASISFE